MEMLIMAPMGPGTYGSQVGRPKKKKKGMSTGPVKMKTKSTGMRKGTANVTSSVNDQLRKKKERSSEARTGSFPTGRLKVNMKKMPPEVQKKLMDAMKKKKKPYNPYGKGSGMDPSKASRTTGP